MRRRGGLAAPELGIAWRLAGISRHTFKITSKFVVERIVEHKTTMGHFLANAETPVADAVMISSLRGQPFFEARDLANLAAKIKPDGILLIYNPDFDFSLNEEPLEKYFNLLHEVRYGEKQMLGIWQRL